MLMYVGSSSQENCSLCSFCTFGFKLEGKCRLRIGQQVDENSGVDDEAKEQDFVATVDDAVRIVLDGEAAGFAGIFGVIRDSSGGEHEEL